jgi:hypothetical protein
MGRLKTKLTRRRFGGLPRVCDLAQSVLYVILEKLRRLLQERIDVGFRMLLHKIVQQSQSLFCVVLVPYLLENLREHRVGGPRKRNTLLRRLLHRLEIHSLREQTVLRLSTQNIEQSYLQQFQNVRLDFRLAGVWNFAEVQHDGAAFDLDAGMQNGFDRPKGGVHRLVLPPSRRKFLEEIVNLEEDRVVVNVLAPIRHQFDDAPQTLHYQVSVPCQTVIPYAFMYQLD